MHNIYTFALGLILVASQAAADKSSYRNQGNDRTASPPVAASKAKGIENTSPYQGTGRNAAAVQTIDGQNRGAPDEQSASVIAEPFNSDYLDGGYFGGRYE